MNGKPIQRKTAKRVYIIATLTASILLKMAVEKIMELSSKGSLSPHDTAIALFASIVGLIAVFVMFETST